MKINTIINKNHQAEITVEIEVDVLEKAKRQAAKNIAKKVKIPGFRKGKAPYGVVVRNVGEKAILDDAIEIIIDDLYPKAIEEAAIKPYGPGKLEEIENLTPPVFKFIVPLAPEVNLGNYKDLRKPYKTQRVTKKEINEALNNLRENQAIIQPVERSAAVDDIVTVNLTATKHTEDNNDEIIIDNDSIPFTIRKDEEANNKDKEWPFDGFSQELIGLKEGDEIDITHDYDDNSPYAELKNSKVTYKIIIESVKERVLPEVDDQFASLYSYPDVDTLKKEIKNSIKQHKLDEYNREYDDEILKIAIAQAEFKYPPEAVDEELTHVIDGLKNRLLSDNLDLELYLKTRGITYDDLLEESRPIAEEQLKRSLFLYEIAKEEDIHVNNEELQKETQNTFNYLAQSLDKKGLRKLQDKQVINNIIGNVEMDLIIRKATDHLRDVFGGKLETEEINTKKENEPIQDIKKEDNDSVDDDKKSDSKVTSPPKKKKTTKKTSKKPSKKLSSDDKGLKDAQVDNSEDSSIKSNEE